MREIWCASFRPSATQIGNAQRTLTRSAGIGLGIARRLGREGASVVISSRKQSNVDEAVATLRREGLSIVGCVAHVGDKSHLKHLVQVDRPICTRTVHPRCVGVRTAGRQTDAHEHTRMACSACVLGMRVSTLLVDCLACIRNGLN
jgi:NAD(P)-dependent dehydrogenase (short-subunit alcohol dehydrogenase family)